MWELQTLKQILRRGLRADAFDQTNDADLSSATSTSMSQQQPKKKVSGIIPIESNEQEPSIILHVSSPVSLPSPIAPIDAMKTKAKDAPLLDAACQVDHHSFEQEPPPPPPPPPSKGEESTSMVPSPLSLPASPPPSPPQELFEVTSENEAKEEKGLLGEMEEVKEPSVGEENDSRSYSSEFSASERESESLIETTDTATGIPPPPPANDNDCSEAEENADDSQGYTGSFDSLSISSQD